MKTAIALAIGMLVFASFPAAAQTAKRACMKCTALCNKCGKLVDLELSIPVALIAEASALSKFNAESLELTLRGLCPDCCK